MRRSQQLEARPGARRPTRTGRARAALVGATLARAFASTLCALALASTAAGVYATLEIHERRSFDSLDASALQTQRAGIAFGAPVVARTATQPAAPTGTAPLAGRSGAVAMIGDSWISLGKMTDPVRDALARRGVIDVPVRSFGQGGAVSRQILRNLVSKDPADPAHSSRAVLEAGDVRYCVVIAGVNDSAQHLGPDFYAHHTAEIARALLAHGITPLIVELPEYGIETLYEQRTGVRRAKDLVLSRLFDDGEIAVIEKYRAALHHALIDAGLAPHVTVVDFDAVATDFDASRDLYADPSHLNERGRARLAAVLADALMERFARDGRTPASVQVASR